MEIQSFAPPRRCTGSWPAVSSPGSSRVYPALTRVADDHSIVGRTIESISARSTHLLIAFSGDLVLRTHLRMHGGWHIYPPGARWQRPAPHMRVLVATAEACASGSTSRSPSCCRGNLARHAQLQALGPDLLGDTFGRDAALGRMRARAADSIADALLNQRVVAGIGNVFKSEILFLAGLDPFTPVPALADADLERIVDLAREQLTANVMSRSQTPSRATGRRTTRSLDPNAKLWVYSRGGKACRRCGAIIQSKKTGLDARLTYWCPACQLRPFPRAV